MLYNQDSFLPHYKMAGKITILTAVVGLLLFVVAFLADFGSDTISRASAQNSSASTSLTVLNVPPFFLVGAYEVIGSSAATPTNSGDVIQWAAIGEDTNGAPYFLLICSTNASPTANAATIGNLGTAPPECDSGATQWGVSAAATSGEMAIVSTTTTESAPFGEENVWYAWVCDDDPNNPECNDVPVQGLNATNSSPFNVNSRPTFSLVSNDGPADPAGTITFSSTSTDPDAVPAADELFMVVCEADTYSTTTNDCGVDTLATSSIGVTADAFVAYGLPSIIQDQDYDAFVYIFDEHGHEASGAAQGSNSIFTVNNVPPEAPSGQIILNGGLIIDSLVAGAESNPASTTLEFVLTDANSCENFSGGDEIGLVNGFTLSVFRSDVGSTTCDGSAGSYNPNNCYPSGVDSSTWNLSCTASSTSCTGPLDNDVVYDCTFPLWFVADPTDAGSFYEASDWSAGVAGIDDNGSTTVLSTSSGQVELQSLTAFDVSNQTINFGELEPGDNTGNLNASSTFENIGNTGLDQDVRGTPMCDVNVFNAFPIGCPTVATSSIPDNQQQFASTSISYNDPDVLILSSTTYQEVELDVFKTTSTSTPQIGATFFGIAVPGDIEFSGIYTGLNEFIAVTAEPADWE